MSRPEPPPEHSGPPGERAPQPRPDGRFAGFGPAGPAETVRANRTWWDAESAGYLAEHGDFLAGGLIWGPEGLDEAEAGLLGEVAGLDVLEVGAGSAQCSTWLAGRGARVLATDLSAGMLRLADRASPGPHQDVPRLQCDARALPLADARFDVAFTAYGALPFVADPERVHAEVHRVLRPGGRWVFSTTHPFRWAFRDDPGPRGLRAVRSYFDRTPYLETDEDGRVDYAEHHRTLGDRVRELVGAGFTLLDVVEPAWPQALKQVWGGWSPLRGQLIPGTAIFVSRKPG